MAKQKSEHHRVVNEFHQAFLSRYERKPTWTGKQVRIVKELLRKHDADDIIERANYMLSDAVKWPPHPRTIETLSVHFDKFIPVEQVMSPSDAWAAVARLIRARGRNVDRDQLDALPVKVRTAVKMVGYYNLCSWSAKDAQFRFMSAYRSL